MTRALRSVAMLGGTFDPVHIGHLRSALEVRERLGLDELRLVPCHRPPHRAQPGASAEHRLRMLELALAGETQLRADARELRRAGPSYTIDTLTELRAELGEHCSLSLVMGADAFDGLDSWHRWRELPQLAHIVVVARPGYVQRTSGAVAELLRALQAEPAALRQSTHGRIAMVALTPLPVSATGIRTLLREGRSPRYLVPDAVWSYIREHALYRTLQEN